MKNFSYEVMPRGGLASSMNATQLTLALSTGTGAQFPATGPFTVTVSLGSVSTDPTVAQLTEGETVTVASRSGDTLTLLERNVNGNTATLTHSTGNLVQMLWTPEDVSRLYSRIDALEMMLGDVVGRLSTGVKMVGTTYDQLEVQQQGSPDMTLLIKKGSAFVNRLLTYIAADFTTPVIVAPVTSTRTDLVTINQETDGIVVTTGVEGGGTPSTPSGHCILASVVITTSHTTLVTGDITDARPTL